MFRLKIVSAAAMAVTMALPGIAIAQSTSSTTSNTLVNATPTNAEAAARVSQTWLNRANAPYANQLGTGNGSGVLVGIVDTGLNVNHPSLRGSIAGTFNALNGSSDVTDQVGHGTHVAGIIAGSVTNNNSKIQGVATGVKLAIAKGFSSAGSDSVTITRGIDWVVNTQKASILSLSLGAASPALETTMRNAVGKNVLITAALGNEGKTNSANWPAAFARESWANSQIIAVGALDVSNKRASFSNYDPRLANWTVYAPGTSIMSSYSSTSVPSWEYASMSGTSMATPVVAGQAALLKSNWNFLSAKNLASIIFESATRLCSDGTSAANCARKTTADAMYGWGLVNISASLQPLGQLGVPTATGSIQYAGTKLSTGKGGLLTGMPGLSLVATDKFNRGFQVSLNAPIAPSASPKSNAASPTTNTTTVVTPPKKGFSYAFSSETSEDSVGMTGFGFAKSNLDEDGKGTAFGFAKGSSGKPSAHAESVFMGLESTGLTPLNLTAQNGGHQGGGFNSPFFALNDSESDLAEDSGLRKTTNTFAGYGFGLTSNTMVKFGLMTTHGQPRATVNQEASNIHNLGTLMETDVVPATFAGSLVTSAEIQTRLQDGILVATVGRLQENGSILGASGSGSMQISGNNGKTATDFVTFAVAQNIGYKTSLSAMATFGQSQGFTNSVASLIDTVGTVRSQAWSLGLSKSDVIRAGDKLGFTVSMPLRAMSGEMQLMVPVTQSQDDGAIGYATQTVTMMPSGRQQDFQMSYSSTLGSGMGSLFNPIQGATFTLVAKAKMQPGHDANASTQFGLSVRVSKEF